MVDTKSKIKWQNLFHLKCPNCGEKLQESNKYLTCPTPHETEPDRNCFFIKKEKVAELLLNPLHPANFCLTTEERAKIKEMIATDLNIEE